MLSNSPNHLPSFLARLKWYYLDSLKGRLIALSLGLSLTLMWALVFLSTSFQQQKFSEVLFDQQFTSVRHLAADIAGELQGRVGILTVSAARIPDKLSPRVLDDHLSQLVTLHQAFTSGIIVIGLDGRVMADYPSMPGRRGMDVGERDYFQNVVKTGKPAIATLVTARSSQRPTLVITVPVRDHAGKVRAILAGATDLSAPNFFSRVFERKMAGKGQFYITSPHNHLVLASTDPARVLTAAPAPGQHAVYDRFVAGFEGSTSARNTEGIATLFSASSIPMANWLVTATYPAEVAFQPVTAMRNYLIAMAVIMTLLAVFLTHWITRRMLIPLDEAGQAIQRMTQDAVPFAPLPLKGKGEVGGIINHFNVLVEDHHRSAAALAASEQRFRTLFERAPDAIYVCNRGCFAYANAATLDLFGAHSQDQLLGHPILDRVHPDLHGVVETSLQSVIEAKESVALMEVKLQRMDGSVVYARISAIPFHYENEPAALVFARDITQRIHAEKALRESEERFRRLVALSSEWYWEHDENFVVTTVAGWKAIKNGRIPEHSIGKTSWELGLGSDEPSWKKHRTSVEARLPFTDFEYTRQLSDGSIAWHHVSGEPVHDENGEYKGYRGTGKDITERKLAEKALRESEERFRRLVALSSEWYWEHDENCVMTTIAGWKSKKSSADQKYQVGKIAWERRPGSDDPSRQAQLAKVEARCAFKDFEYARTEPDGSVIWYSISGEPMFDEDGTYKGYRGTGKDITERKLAEAALRQSQARIRELAAHQEEIKEQERKRIARDIHDELGQTMLAIRLDAVTLTEKTAATHADLHGSALLMLDHIDTAMASVKAIINDLRPFVLDLGLVAAVEWQIHEFESRSGIACDLEVDGEDFSRHLDARSSTALFRVLQESLTNITRHAKARQARIVIRTEHNQLDMTIADNGIGIAPDHLNKKSAFGLAGIKERINALGGKFTMDSAPGKGTTLRFSIPIPVPIKAPC
ncbi:PAS domain S-box protein [Noviherbaspirillum sedimenti]|uniref:Oxygen sensor histidine kinase NreB n=1 Tax=Noviherbaspirillum sedimenti TaxID=2320865 RepID=A0A3A3G3V5_9BURK|nr:PAS domain S-box protein [Noviherbaspirillum sedimenti]RJG03183.1 PAS domain S-box protein [Noviherbaspirillum sedimenti]